MKNNCVLILLLCFSAIADTQIYKTIQWVDLMPPEDIDALYLNPPNELLDIPEGTDDDMTDEEYEKLINEMDKGYKEALSSTKIIESLNKTQIKIPGYIVPVKIKGNKTTEFFIVPYFGACLHYPAPPPNQTIYSLYEAGIELDKINEPFQYSGLLSTSIKENEIATAAYQLQVHQIEEYTD